MSLSFKDKGKHAHGCSVLEQIMKKSSFNPQLTTSPGYSHENNMLNQYPQKLKILLDGAQGAQQTSLSYQVGFTTSTETYNPRHSICHILNVHERSPIIPGRSQKMFAWNHERSCKCSSSRERSENFYF